MRSIKVIIEKRLGAYPVDDTPVLSKLSCTYSKDTPTSDELLKTYLDVFDINNDTVGEKLINTIINSVVQTYDISNSISFVLKGHTITVRLENIEEDN